MKVLSALAAAIAISIYTGCSQESVHSPIQTKSEELVVSKADTPISVIINGCTKSRVNIGLDEVTIVEALVQLKNLSGDLTELQWTSESGDTLLFASEEDGEYELTVIETDANGKQESGSKLFTVASGTNYSLYVELGKKITIDVNSDITDVTTDNTTTNTKSPETRNLTSLPIWSTVTDTNGSYVEIKYYPSLDTIFRTTIGCYGGVAGNGKAGIVADLGVPPTGLAGITGIELTYRTLSSVIVGLGTDSLADSPENQYQVILPSSGPAYLGEAVWDTTFIPIQTFMLSTESSLTYEMDLSKLHTLCFWGENSPTPTQINLDFKDIRLIYE